MYKLQIKNRGGSVISYVLVAIAAMMILMGAVYFVIQRGETVRKDDAIAQLEKEENDLKQESNDESTTVDKTVDDDSTDVDETSSLPVTGQDVNWLQVSGLFFVVMSVVSYISSLRLSKSHL